MCTVDADEAAPLRRTEHPNHPQKTPHRNGKTSNLPVFPQTARDPKPARHLREDEIYDRKVVKRILYQLGGDRFLRCALALFGAPAARTDQGVF
jgi:hypothetical protein